MIEFWLKNILLIQKSHGKNKNPLQMMMFSWLRFALWPSRASMISLHMHLDSQEHILKGLNKNRIENGCFIKILFKKMKFYLRNTPINHTHKLVVKNKWTAWNVKKHICSSVLHHVNRYKNHTWITIACSFPSFSEWTNMAIMNLDALALKDFSASVCSNGVQFDDL